MRIISGWTPTGRCRRGSSTSTGRGAPCGPWSGGSRTTTCTTRRASTHRSSGSASRGGGQASVQQALVLVVDPAWVEPILQRLWARLLAAAGRNDMQEVLSLTYYLKRDELRLGLEALGPGALAQWAAMMGDGSLVLKRVADGIAVCDWRVQGRRDSPIEFVLDPSGLYWQWRMR